MKIEIDKTVTVLKKGGLIVYPTDTIWGLGCDATDNTVVSKIFKLKQRNDSKSVIILVSSLQMLMDYVSDIPHVVVSILKKELKPLTIIYDNPKGVASNCIANDNTVGIRVTHDPFCKQLIEYFGKPIVSTSANISGYQSPKQYSDIQNSILDNVDYVVDLYRESITEKSSKIIRIIGDQVEIIRP